MRDRDADALAVLFQEKARIYVKEVGGRLHASVHIFSRDVMLIDRLVRAGIGGKVNVIPGGTRDWSWAKRSDFRKYLPAIISRMDEGKQKELLTLVYKASVSGQRRDDVLRELTARKSVFHGRPEDVGGPDSSDG